MLSYILGTVRLRCRSSECLNILVRENVQCSDIQYKCDAVEFTLDLFSYFRAKRYLGEAETACERIAIKGIPSYIIRYRKRWGLALGIIIFSVVSLISGRYIWSFEVKGNSTVPDAEIIELLGELGCSVGTRISGIDFDMLHNDFLLRSDDISWISVNMDGTKANVEVREVKKGKSKVDEQNNIVAREDGQIHLVTVAEGKSQVAIGDVVRKGDLLISGVSTYREGEKNYFGAASGNVYAVVNRRINVKVDSIRKVKGYTGEETANNVLKIFGFSVNLFINSSIQYANYDTIVENRQIVLFDTVSLPLWIERRVSREYVENEAELSETEARVIAVKEYRDKLNEIAEDCELLSIECAHSFENGVYEIDCNLYCIADIAESVPYTIENESKDITNVTEKDQRIG